jgi:hypothetical protein
MAQPMQQPMMQRRSSRAPWLVLLVIVIVVLAVLGYLFRDKLGMGSAEKTSGYEAVFLTNGQVYFGKLSHAQDEYATLTDIYYLQVNGQNGQTGSAQQPAAGAAATDQSQLSLVKLGNELHGPVDSMQINRDQILFFEELKADGKVAQAIAEYKKNGGNPPAAPAPAGQTPATTPPATTPTK